MPRATRERIETGIYRRRTTHGTRYDVTYRVPGEQNPRWENGLSSLDAARKRRAELQVAANHGDAPKTKATTLAAFVESDWLPYTKGRTTSRNLRTSSAKLYEADTRKHILPALGNTRLDRIDEEKIEKLQDELLATGLSTDTVRRATNTLSGILQLAIQRRHIRHNPARNVEKPEMRRRTPTLPTLATLAQLYRLADAAPNITVRTLVLVGAMTGLRKSELLGLRWANVALTEGQEALVVREQFYRGEWVDRPKTKAGARLVPLPKAAAEVLRTLSASQIVDGHPNPEGLVFPNGKGKPIQDSNLSVVWNRMRQAAELPELKFHTLRYFFVTHVRSTGLPSSVTEQLVGHDDARTHQGYSRPLPGDEALARVELSAVFPGDPREAA
ncbi:MAG: tyrosine-type recombinase/integrase [Gaiellaceae bacterium]